MSVEKNSTVNLSHELKQLYHSNSKDPHMEQQRRQQACDELLDHLKGLLHEKITTDAKLGRPETRLLEFKHKDNLKFGGCFAKDLLTKSDVIARLQKYLDTEHGDGTGEPVFFVYFTSLGRHQESYEETKFGLFVNWDVRKWPEIKARLTHHQPRSVINGRGTNDHGTSGSIFRSSQGRRFHARGPGMRRGTNVHASPPPSGTPTSTVNLVSQKQEASELPMSHDE